VPSVATGPAQSRLTVEIVLSPFEQRIARHLAQARQSANDARGNPDTRVTPNESSVAINLEGVGAELAFCRVMNVYPYEVLCADAPVPHDAFVMGRQIDVKSTRHRAGHLIAIRKKVNAPSDVYALMVGDFPAYRFAGLIAAEQLFRDERIKEFGHGKPCYAVPQSDLQSVADWLADMERAEAQTTQ
jgi:Family of unknown function (DUF5843)